MKAKLVCAPLQAESARALEGCAAIALVLEREHVRFHVNVAALRHHHLVELFEHGFRLRGAQMSHLRNGLTHTLNFVFGKVL